MVHPMFWLRLTFAEIEIVLRGLEAKYGLKVAYKLVSAYMQKGCASSLICIAKAPMFKLC